MDVKRRRLKLFVLALGLGYAGAMLGFFAWRILWPNWPPWLALVNAFAPFLFGLLPLMLLSAWLVRSRAALASSALVALLFIAVYGSLFAPHIHLMAVPKENALTAMTFNLGYDRSSPEALAQVIKDEQADIVAVQEFSHSTAELLRTRLAADYPYAILAPDVSTSGLLSRYPILTYEWFEPPAGGRPSLHAVLDVKGRSLHVFAIHPNPPGLSWYRGTLIPTGLYDQEQQAQVMDVARRAASLAEPVVVLGDFNLNDQSRAYAQMTRLLDDSYREAGHGFGFTFPYRLQVGPVPVPGPLVRIDYIFHSDDWRAKQARVVCKTVSDHCYVKALLAAASEER